MKFTVEFVSVKSSRSKLTAFWHANLVDNRHGESFGDWRFASEHDCGLYHPSDFLILTGCRCATRGGTISGQTLYRVMAAVFFFIFQLTS